MIGQIFLKLLLIGVLSAPVCGEEWKAKVVKEMDALVGSCVVVPCSFSHPKEYLSTSRLRGKWHRTKEKEQLIYYEDQTRVLESFRSRTRLLGELGKGNCSLEMIEIKDHDNGPFCFRIELARTEGDVDTIDKFSFVEDCVTLRMMSEPLDPSLTFRDPVEGGPSPSPALSLTLAPPTSPAHMEQGSRDDITESHRELHAGNQILRTDDIVQKMTLYVKRVENYNHIIIPVTVAVGLAALFGGLCILMVKKYKKRIEELQQQDGTMFNRLSRLSEVVLFFFSYRIRSPREIHSGHRPQNNYDAKCSKPRFPSPKSERKTGSYAQDDGDDYMNTADLNVYGNL
ncbi:hypothetical protein WMY93_008608 [Mugilogobius chulae]|uniref:Immunoglobulin subtype domain-containing protein n=1 Tax=Mugilogobius chulae TaxID=88201 RepID=A0AAW0PGR8_9GOBI